MKFPTVYYDDNGNAIAGPEIEAQSLEEANLNLRLLAAYDPADGMPEDAAAAWKIRYGLPSGTLPRHRAAIHTNVIGDYPQAANEFFAPAYQEEE